jgi:hypothetical protein
MADLCRVFLGVLYEEFFSLNRNLYKKLNIFVRCFFSLNKRFTEFLLTSETYHFSNYNFFVIKTYPLSLLSTSLVAPAGAGWSQLEPDFCRLC